MWSPEDDGQSLGFGQKTFLHSHDSDIALSSNIDPMEGNLALTFATKMSVDSGKCRRFWHPTMMHGGDSDTVRIPRVCPSFSLREMHFQTYKYFSILLESCSCSLHAKSHCLIFLLNGHNFLRYSGQFYNINII